MSVNAADTSAAISASERRNVLGKSARLTMPISLPSASTTGSRLRRCALISRAPVLGTASGPIVTAGAVMSAAAFLACVLARAARCSCQPGRFRQR